MTIDTMIVALEHLREHVRGIVLSGDLKDLSRAAYPDEGEPNLRARAVLTWATSTLSVDDLSRALGIRRSPAPPRSNVRTCPGCQRKYLVPTGDTCEFCGSPHAPD